MARGSAGPRPERKERRSGGSRDWMPTFRFEEDTENGPRWLEPFFIKRGDSEVPIVVLDQGTNVGVDDKGKKKFKLDYYVRLHFMFDYNGNFKNAVVCSEKSDPRGCPVCDGGNCNKASQFYGVGTILNCTEFYRRARDGEKADSNGKVLVKSKRQLLLIPEQKIDEIDGIISKAGGGRGACFDISRGTEQTSSRIGTTWWPSARMSEQDMLEHFSADAAAYGMTPEEYVEPIDYDKVLRVPSYEELQKVAAALHQEKHGTEAAAKTAPSDLTDEEAVPF